MRFLVASGVMVRYVQNVTDVDDPLFERAKRDGVEWQELARRALERHLGDTEKEKYKEPQPL